MKIEVDEEFSSQPQSLKNREIKYKIILESLDDLIILLPTFDDATDLNKEIYNIRYENCLTMRNKLIPVEYWDFVFKLIDEEKLKNKDI